MQVRLLGPVDVTVDGVPRPVRGLRRKAVLAVLALRRGEVVSTDLLVDVVWGTAAPSTAANTLQSHVSHLRQVLGSKAAIISRPPGYVLDLDSEATDVEVAERLIRQGTRSADHAGRARQLMAALALWRGRPLVDVAGLAWLDEQAQRLDQLWLQAKQALIETRLALGEHAQLLPDLARLTREHPFDEEIHRQLILALYRTGRQAEALAAYRRLRRTLGEDLGIDPSQPLRDLEAAILRQDPALDPAPAAGTLPAAKVVDAGPEPVTPAGPAAAAPAAAPIQVPAQLPTAVRDLAGRGVELASLDVLLPGLAEPGLAPPGAIIVAVSGTAGVGKTALAVHWAHQVAAQFPDGQLYVNLRGFDPCSPALDPAEAVRGFLDAFGIPAERIPVSLAAQAGLYRSVLAGKRVLVLLDNASDVEQVRSLLPGSPGCLTLVTSRNNLTGLVATEGAHPLTVDLLSQAQARDLLALRLGAGRVAAEPAAVDDIIAGCARLPLALAIAAARAATHPSFPLAVIAAELREASRALDAFHDGDRATDVRAVFSWSYRTLSTGAAALFRLLGLRFGNDITVAAAASLGAIPPARARTLLAELARAHLLTEHVPGRYTSHDLLCVYAAELARRYDSGDAALAARGRLIDHYLRTARSAALLLNPVQDPIAGDPPQPGAGVEEIAGYQQALAWFTAERLVLLATIEYAPADLDAYVWQLACALTTFLDRQGHWQDLISAQDAALAAAGRTGDLIGAACAHRSLGLAYVGLERFDDARTHYNLALDGFRELGNDTGQAQTHQNLGWMSDAEGHHRQALDHAQRSLRHFRNCGNRVGQARALSNIGWHHAQLDDHDQALVFCEQALAIHQEFGDLNGQAHTCDSLGYIHHHLGRHQQAIVCYRRALELFRLTGDRRSEATGLAYLGDSYFAVGDPEGARQAQQQALEILDQLSRPGAGHIGPVPTAQPPARDDPQVRAERSRTTPVPAQKGSRNG
jgi:DNA-binding SARP family transcriptional activator